MLKRKINSLSHSEATQMAMALYDVIEEIEDEQGLQISILKQYSPKANREFPSVFPCLCEMFPKPR